jgi:HSP20 family molecular chaperone IbpA
MSEKAMFQTSMTNPSFVSLSSSSVFGPARQHHRHHHPHAHLQRPNAYIRKEPDNTDNVRMFKIQLNVSDFMAAEIDIKYDPLNNCLLINGIKSNKTFNNQIQLPPQNQIDTKTIKSYLMKNPNGNNLLSIEIPFLHKHPEPVIKPVISGDQQFGVLKYKFNLKDYKADDIQICIKEGRTLVIYASTEVYDHYGKMTRDFNREINLPSNVNPYKIKNYYNSVDGILYIEIPLTSVLSDEPTPATNPISSNLKYVNTTTTTDTSINDSINYLEILFDLTGYDLDDVQIQTNHRSNYVLKVRGLAHQAGDDVYYRQYMLPDWLDTNNYQVFKRVRDDPNKNIIVVKIPIRK